jgi:hypothetical protein
MLRWVLLLLVAANAVFFAWSQGLFSEQGWAPARINEPQRLQQEVQPSAIRLLNSPTDPAETPTPVVPAVVTEPTSCLWVPGFSAAQADTLRQAMERLALPAETWSLTEARGNGRWIVYWGKFDQPDVLAQRKARLRQLNIDFREVTLPRLAPGLALGTFSNEAAAQEALLAVQAKGIKTARVALERAETVSWALRLPAITEAQRSVVLSVGEALAGKTLLACP